jgi:hypothetical protein
MHFFFRREDGCTEVISPFLLAKPGAWDKHAAAMLKRFVTVVEVRSYPFLLCRRDSLL